LDGLIPPPLGTPNPYVEWPGGANYNVYRYHVDFANPGNSTFILATSPPRAGFTQLCPGTLFCVPQPTVGARVDGLGQWLMFRNAYRNINNGTLVNNFAVSSGGVAGIRWFELQHVNFGTVVLHQESTYQPDSTWRWAGSAAMDNQGNMALAYSVSSSAVYPGLRYSGRLWTDPVGTLAQGEATLSSGGGGQPANNHRWGDYSDLTVDPADDCTFWYTNQYSDFQEPPPPEFYWSTRIGTFKFPGCMSPAKGTAHFIVTACQGVAFSNALISIDGTLYGSSDQNGIYDAVLAVGFHNYSVSAGIGAATGTFSISNGQTLTIPVCLKPIIAIADFNGDTHPDFVLYNTASRHTDIWYLNNNTLIGSAFGPSLSGSNWQLIGAADFNQDGHPDYLLYNPNTQQTGIWYLNNNTLIGSAFGPSLPDQW
jgi:FG-GAP-like repeat